MRIAIALLLISANVACADPPAANANAPIAKRRVFVLHSGLHTVLSDPHPNFATENIRDVLIEDGIKARDIVLIRNPFPLATLKNLFPRDSLTMFLESTLPNTRTSHDAYVRLHRALVQQEVSLRDELVWIGHSAGGQMGMTMAHLADAIAKYPQLAKEAKSYRFDMVVTLGTPVGSNLVPPDVKLRHYFSPEDRVVRLASIYGTFALRALGQKIRLLEFPPDLRGDSVVRIFQEVEHPYWDEARIVRRVLREFQPPTRPLWQSPALVTSFGQGLSCLLTRVMEEEYRVALEDPPVGPSTR